MALSKLAVRRLTTLANFMAKLPKKAEKHFSMRSWLRHDGDNHHGFETGKRVMPKELVTCGTTACALGWATAIPRFRRAGLHIVYDHCGSEVAFGEIKEAFSAASEFFDISYSDAEDLFYDEFGHIDTPKQWAKHCRQFIKDNS